MPWWTSIAIAQHSIRLRVKIQMAGAPKAFISHASEDKARFVLAFATLLRTSGVDAWLDKWEMLPGDSLVDKIFEEGIKEAAAFVVVLSDTSVQKKWVREEMNAAFVARISRQCKVIPVVIDDCEIPEALKSTLWERIHDLNNYEESLKRIVASIFGTPVKPPIGAPPAFVTNDSAGFAPELERTDAAVLWRLCEAALAEGQNVIGDLAVLDVLATGGMARSDILDALEILDEHGLIVASKVLGGGYLGSSISHAVVNLSGFDLFVRYKFPNFDEMVGSVAGLIVNEKVCQSAELERRTGYAPFVVEHIVDLLANNNLLTVTKHYGGFWIRGVSASLGRKLR